MKKFLVHNKKEENIMQDKKFNIEDTAYYQNGWSGLIIQVVIEKEIYEDGSLVGYAVHDTDIGGSIDLPIERLFPTREAAELEVKRQSDEQIKNYKSCIHDIKDLLKFALDNNLSSGAGEYFNPEARTAFLERVKELGFDL